jgi:pyruvate,water dikinase
MGKETGHHISLDSVDRSMTSLRTLRFPNDEDIFWFRDDLHQPYPISPMGMTTIQKHHSWGYHVAAEETKLPPSMGGHVKVYKGRVFLGFVGLTDPKVIEERAAHHGKLLDYLRTNWDEYYERHIEEVLEGLSFMRSVNDGMSDKDLHNALVRSEQINRRNWEIHFTLMYPADGLYFEFEAFCREHGLEEKDMVVMLLGIDTMATRTDRALWELAKQAEESGISDLFLSNDEHNILKALENDAKTAGWLKSFYEFLDVYGHRITAAHLDVIFPTWIEEPSPVFGTIKTYIPKIRDGWDIAAERQKMIEDGEEAAGQFMAKLSDDDKERFKGLLEVGRKIYHFQEDHGFFIDGASTADLHHVLLVCGRRLAKYGLLKDPDEVFYLAFVELEEVMESLALNKVAAIYHYNRLLHGLTEERKWGWNQTSELQEAPLTLGTVPEKLEDPIMIKVFGMIDEVIKAGKVDELKVMDRFEGYSGAPGVVEGVARVITSFEDFPKLQQGDLLVCPYTATAWTPLFPKIRAVVTDTGGMLTHAAITAREYKIPAVVGTWRATRSIKDGDTIRVDGNAGTVEVLKKAKK